MGLSSAPEPVDPPSPSTPGTTLTVADTAQARPINTTEPEKGRKSMENHRPMDVSEIRAASSGIGAEDGMEKGYNIRYSGAPSLGKDALH